jgi:hypothetical protein
MAMFVTLFVASEVQLDLIFPGWLRPARQPTCVQCQDPSTGAQAWVKRWTPPTTTVEQAKLPSGSPPAPFVPPALPTESEFEQHMEERAPSVLRALPHACLKNLFVHHLESLAALLLGNPIDARPARVTPDGFAIDRLPDEAVVALAHLPGNALDDLAARWASDRKQGFEGPADALWVLRRIQALAQLCTNAEQRSLCLWVEA